MNEGANIRQDSDFLFEIAIMSELKEILEKNREKMKEIQNFDKVDSLINQLLQVIASVPHYMKMLEDGLEKFLNENP